MEAVTTAHILTRVFVKCFVTMSYVALRVENLEDEGFVKAGSRFRYYCCAD